MEESVSCLVGRAPPIAQFKIIEADFELGESACVGSGSVMAVGMFRQAMKVAQGWSASWSLVLQFVSPSNRT